MISFADAESVATRRKCGASTAGTIEAEPPHIVADLYAVRGVLWIKSANRARRRYGWRFAMGSFNAGLTSAPAASTSCPSGCGRAFGRGPAGILGRDAAD